MTEKQINDLKNAIVNSINEGFRGQQRAFKSDGKAMERPSEDATKSEWDAFFKAMQDQKRSESKIERDRYKSEKNDELQEQIDALNSTLSNYSRRDQRIIQEKIDILKNEQERLNKGGLSEKDVNKIRQEKSLEAWEKIAKAFESAGQIATGIVDMTLAIRKSGLQQQKNLFERTQKTFQANMEMSNVVASNVVTAISSFATQTATEAGRALAQGAKEEANARIKQIAAIEMANKEFANAEEQREIDRNRAEAAAASSMAQGAAGIASLFGPVGAIVGIAINSINGIAQTGIESVQKFKEFDLEKAKQQTEIYNTMMGNISQVADKVKKIVDGIDQTANQLADYVRSVDTIYRNTGLAMGFAGDTYAKYMRSIAADTAKYFNITAEQMKEMQNSYINSSNRAVMMSASDYNQMTAVSKTFGVSQGEVSGAIGEMNVFNTSVESAYGMYDTMFHQITKMGLSTTKFAKDLTNNLKLAQKYNFKGGVENMMKLTKWAQQTRFNLNSAASFADSIMNDSLSGALEKSAKLQVLGGNAAIYSDPLGMLYDAGADVGNMAQRMASMFGDLTGTFNSKTGETEFDWYENRMIAARAQALGMDPGEVKNMIRQNQKQGVIDRELSGFGLDDETRTAIGNRATYVEGKGFMVNTINGEQKSIQEVARMSDEERNKILLPANQEEAIMEIATNTRSLVEIEEAQKGEEQAKLGEEMYGSVKAASDILLQAQKDLYASTEFRTAMKESVVEQARTAATEMKSTLEFLKKNGDDVQGYRNFVREQIGKSVVFQDEEVAILRTISKANGLDKLSKFANAIGSIHSAANDKDREELLKNFRNDEDIKELIREWEKDKTQSANQVFARINPVSQSDGMGSMNGGYIVGASNVKSINDGVVKTSPRDQYVAAETGGPIDILFKQLLPGLATLINLFSGNSNSKDVNINHQLSGTVYVSQNGSTIDLREILGNPSTLNQVLDILNKGMEVNSSGKTANSLLQPRGIF